MPTYEYECNECEFLFERKQRFDEEPVAMCPKCEGRARRVIHSVPIIFKGSGFYVTDSRKSTAPAPATKGVSGKGKKGRKGRKGK
jgi:putative FmdB family regulatory protein